MITTEQMEDRVPGQLFYEKIRNYDFIIFLLVFWKKAMFAAFTVGISIANYAISHNE